MPVLEIRLQGDSSFKDWFDRYGEPIHLGGDAILRIAGLEAGMTSGKPSVAIGFILGDGQWVLAETSLALLLTAADALKARFGDPRT